MPRIELRYGKTQIPFETNEDQFEILGSNRGVDQDPNKIYGKGSYLNGKEVYKRLFIKHRKK